jgi:hypothetical protein
MLPCSRTAAAGPLIEKIGYDQKERLLRQQQVAKSPATRRNRKEECSASSGDQSSYMVKAVLIIRRKLANKSDRVRMVARSDIAL